jgi:hypothetical protein
MFGKKLITVVVCLHIIVCSASARKSVFIISNHNQNRAQAYSIEGSQVNYQADVDISGNSPIGIAVWPEKNLMFVTYEGSGVIGWSSTTTLEKIRDFETGFGELSGIVIDRIKNLIYVMGRGSSDLHVYSFDENENTIVFEGTWQLNPTQDHYISGLGIALDEIKNLLYVTSYEDYRVHIYDTNDFVGSGGEVAPNSSIDIVVGGEERPAVGIAVDPVRRFMYTGGFGEGGLSHNYLVRTQLDPPYTSTEVLIDNGYDGVPVVGIDVDKDTGYVYATTWIPDFRVYDSNLILKDTEANDISGPAGVAVGGWYKTPSFYLVKDNNDPNNGCVDPNRHKNLTFDIYWDVNGHPDTNMVVIDQLPYELDYNSSTPPAGDYNSVGRTVKWNISGNSGHIVLKTNVTQWAAPSEIISNNAVMEGNTYLTRTSCQVSICNWDGSIIYVDKDANGFKNGTNWNDAYTDLQEALSEARDLSPFITAIWVAAGTYKPVNDVNISGYQSKSFELPDNVALIGHFGGVGTYETSPYQRNLANLANETILDGQIGSDNSQAVQYVIKAKNITAGLIDGFTIKGASYSNIDLDSATVSIMNCKIKDNQYCGIYARNYSYLDIHNCLFMDNYGYSVYSEMSEPDISYCTFDGNGTTYYGLHLVNGSVSNITNSDFQNHASSAIYGSNATINIAGCNIFNNSSYGVQGYSSYMTVLKTIFESNPGYGLYLEYYSDLDIEQCVIRKSGYRGIYLSQNSSTKIVNNWIHNNGTALNSSYGAGIYFENQIGIPIVRNNTIYDNFSYGIECSQNGADPCISNCIISGNDTNDLYRPNGSFNRVSYCLLQHPHSGIGNLTGSPGFMNPADINDLHIAGTSQCKDAGDPYINYDGETDIDGESRVKYGRVDIGGDEYYWSKADYNKDGIVDFHDFVIFGNKWRAQDANISLDADNDVDMYDLDLFCDEWLWEAGWTQGQWMMMAMAGDGGGESSAMMESTSLPETDVAQAQASDALMLSDAKSSIAAGPARLRARSQKFYDITPIASVPVTLASMSMSVDGLAAVEEPVASEEQVEPEQINIEELLDWIDQLWQTGELGGSEEEYLDFRNAVQEVLADESQ